MKILILSFSPSDNTANIGRIFQNELKRHNHEVTHLDITKSTDIIAKKDYRSYFAEKIAEHDIICPGAPVYAHHFQLELIRQLPQPKHKWGKFALPFITYGHIDSGIALQEAGKELLKSGRFLISGMKISAPHTMLETLLQREIAPPSPAENILKVITSAVERINTLEISEQSANKENILKYKPIMKKLIADTLFHEKMCHNKFYPNINIDHSKCTACTICSKKCPTNHLTTNSKGKAVINKENLCIHCFNCIKHCPQQAINLKKDTRVLEKIVKFMTRNGFETPANEIIPQKM